MTRLLERTSGAIRSWTQDPNLRADALFAVLVGVISLVEASSPDAASTASGADTFAYITIVIGAASLLVRRRLPITVLAITSMVLAVFYLRDGGDFLSILGLSAFYAVAAHSDRRGRAWTAMLVTAPVLFALASITILDTPGGYDVDSAVSMGSFIVGAIVFGLIVRNRRRIFADSEQRAAAAEADRQASAARAVAQERSRIAREMHDVVAHGMSVIAVQAAAAQEIVHTNPDKAAEVMGRIENVGRQSLNEMRRMLGMLRNGDDDTAASLAPQPCIADVDAIVARSVDAGVATDLVVTGTQRDLAPGIELTAFRIVQEALTNVLKHAGPAASATVTITYDPGAVTVEITDDGRGAASSLSPADGGHGLIGMHERVEIYGGQLSAGPRTGGGFAVRAVLPTDDAERRPSVGSSATHDEWCIVMTIRVAIVDDQALMRDGFTMILDAQPDIDVVGDAENGRLGVELCQRTCPDVVLMDIRMPVLDGLEATKLIAADERCATKVLVLTTFDLDEYVYGAMRAGASGYLLKDTPAKELVAAVRVIAAGDALLSPSVTKRLIEEFARQPEPESVTAALPSDLTEREHEALELLARGLSNREIAAAMFVGEATAKTHVSRLLTKLGVRDRVQAVVLAYETGVVRPGAPPR